MSCVAWRGVTPWVGWCWVLGYLGECWTGGEGWVGLCSVVRSVRLARLGGVGRGQQVATKLFPIKVHSFCFFPQSNLTGGSSRINKMLDTLARVGSWQTTESLPLSRPAEVDTARERPYKRDKRGALQTRRVSITSCTLACHGVRSWVLRTRVATSSNIEGGAHFLSVRRREKPRGKARGYSQSISWVAQHSKQQGARTPPS